MLQIEHYIPDAFSSTNCVDYISDHFEAGENRPTHWGCTPVVRTDELYLYNSCRFKRNDNDTPLYDLANINSDHCRYRITSQCCPEDSDENLKRLFLLYSQEDVSLLVKNFNKIISRRNGEWFIEDAIVDIDPYFFYFKDWYVSLSYQAFMACISHRVTNFAVEEASSLDSLEAII